MGSGKSTLGRQLAKEWNWGFIDLDHYISELFGMSIPEMFDQYGEAGFRNKESQALAEVLEGEQKTIISLGGGTPCFNQNLQLIKEKTHSIYLKLSVKELTSRLLRSHNPRPLVQNKSEAELQEYIKNELQNRDVFYNQAHQTIQSDSIQASDLNAFIRV